MGDKLGSNPEIVVNAISAALAVQDAATRTNWLLGGVLIVGIVFIIVGLFIYRKVDKLTIHINWMYQALIDTTRKIALIEGEVIGRAKQKQENHEKKDR